MSISELRDRARGVLLEFAWTQWVQLGVSGQRSRSDRWAMDPEALILFTTEVARRDPRLFDETLDWLVRNERLLSLQRLRNLTARFPIDGRLVEALVAWAGQAAPSSRWRTAKPGRGSGERNDAALLFAPDVLSFVPDPDPVFASYGYLRPRVEPSGKSDEPDVRAPVNLAFRLRLLFGVGSRAEVMRILLTTAEGTLDAARIADEAGFAKRNVSEVLSALVETAVVKARWSRNERLFLVYRDSWATLLELGPKATSMPTFVSWVHVLPPLIEVLRWLERESENGDSDYLKSSRARDVMERIGPDLEVTGLAPPAAGSLPGASYLPAFTQIVESLLQAIVFL
jgi:DNA-binding transcriptional regulator GbsR (MarR family)